MKMIIPVKDSLNKRKYRNHAINKPKPILTGTENWFLLNVKIIRMKMAKQIFSANRMCEIIIEISRISFTVVVKKINTPIMVAINVAAT